jgi:hypothetical protein
LRLKARHRDTARTNRFPHLEPAEFYAEVAHSVAIKIGPYKYYFRPNELADKPQKGRSIVGPVNARPR